MIRLVVAGSRTIHSYDVVCLAIMEAGRGLGFKVDDVGAVVSGGAPGVDRLGERWAKEHGVPVLVFPPDWDDISAPNAVIKRRPDGSLYNARAGLDRNVRMAEKGDALVAVWDGRSTGTEHMVRAMRSLDKPVYVKRSG